jgi:hypothetical protein
MGPPDGPSRPKEFEWAHVIQNELNSWDPSCLSPQFQPRSRQRSAAVLRPLPLALVFLIFALLAVTALAAGPRALGTVIGSLTSRPQPSATPVTPHATRIVQLASPGAASGATSGAASTTVAPSASSASRGASSGAPAGQGQPANGGGSGSGGGPTANPPQVQLPPPPQPSQLPQMPTPAVPHLPTLPPLPQLPPVPGGGVPTPGNGSGPPATPGPPITHPAPGPTNASDARQVGRPSGQPAGRS